MKLRWVAIVAVLAACPGQTNTTPTKGVEPPKVSRPVDAGPDRAVPAQKPKPKLLAAVKKGVTELGLQERVRS